MLDFSSVTTHCSPGNLICSSGSGGIFSVQLSGEQNTMINDEITRCNSLNNYEDQSRLVVRLFDTTVYMLRIQLYCVESWNQQDSSFLQTNCNSVHHLGVWIDLNNDGNFDETRERFLHNYQINGVSIRRDYDLSIFISQIDGQNYLDGPHRMRIVLARNENDLKPCYNNGYGEARDYTIHIIPKHYY